MKNTKAAAKKFLAAALARVESASIRSWATSEHNAPIWLQIALNGLNNGRSAANTDDVCRFAAYIVCTAIGA